MERRRASSAAHRANWRSVYERQPYDQLPWFEEGPSPPVSLAVAEGFFRAGGELLDIGCGAGSNVFYLAQNGFRVHGVDLSPGAVAAARARAESARVEVDLREGDALFLPFHDSSLDGLVDNGCFHTLPIGRRSDYARETYRVLRPGGSFVLSWVAREHTAARGPRHRPSLREVTSAMESRFLFARTAFRPGREPEEPSTYFAFLVRRSTRYPPAR